MKGGRAASIALISPLALSGSARARDNSRHHLRDLAAFYACFISRAQARLLLRSRLQHEDDAMSRFPRRPRVEAQLAVAD